MSARTLSITHLTNDTIQREEFYCPLLDGENLAHVLRIEVCGQHTLRLTGYSSSRVKLWEGTVELKEVP